MSANLEEVVFIGLNRNVVALDRNTGQILWDWKSPKGSTYICMLFEGDHLMVTVHGYVYCLDPETGQQLWTNPMKGYGTGVASIASMWGHSDQSVVAMQAQAAAAQAAAAGGAASV